MWYLTIIWITERDSKSRTACSVSVLICWLQHFTSLSSSYYYYTSIIFVSIYNGHVNIHVYCNAIYFSKSLLKDLHYFVHFNLSVALFMGLIIFLAGIDSAKGNDVSSLVALRLLLCADVNFEIHNISGLINSLGINKFICKYLTCAN